VPKLVAAQKNFDAVELLLDGVAEKAGALEPDYLIQIPIRIQLTSWCSGKRSAEGRLVLVSDTWQYQRNSHQSGDHYILWYLLCFGLVWLTRKK
jgi:hypothetical protein